MSVKRITEPFAESADIMQVAINEAEARGEFLSTIILSTPYSTNETFGSEGYWLVFEKPREEIDNESA